MPGKIVLKWSLRKGGWTVKGKRELPRKRNPLLTLLALYTGFRAAGVAGMILFPIGVIFLKQLWDHAGLSGNL